MAYNAFIIFKKSLKYHYLAKFGGIVSREEVESERYTKKEHAIDFLGNSRNLYQFLYQTIKRNMIPWYFDQKNLPKLLCILFFYCFLLLQSLHFYLESCSWKVEISDNVTSSYLLALLICLYIYSSSSSYTNSIAVDERQTANLRQQICRRQILKSK